jgi:hypothetical protein
MLLGQSRSRLMLAFHANGRSPERADPEPPHSPKLRKRTLTMSSDELAEASLASSPKPAFLILVHDDADHFRRLVERVSKIGDCYVHVDLRADLKSFHVTASNVHYCPNRVDVRWCGLSVVVAMKNLMQYALDNANTIQYSHFAFLSGACYPIKPLEDILKYFQSNAGKQIMRVVECVERPVDLQKTLRGVWLYEYLPVRSKGGYINRLIIKLFKNSISKIKRPLPNKYKRYYYGSQWFAITPECAKYVVEIIENSRDFVKYFKLSSAPDELLIQTIVANSEYNAGVQYINAPFGVWILSSYHLIHGSLRKWYTHDDIAEIRKSKKYFVRKLHSKTSDELVRIIDKKILCIDT